MSVERLRNVMTGEIRDAETNSDEYQDLLNEVYDHEGSARPKWEITGQHHARRLDEGDISEEDFGYEHKPIPGALVDVSEVGPELYPERALTQGEVDAGVGSYEEKLEGLPSLTKNLPANPALRDAEPLEKSSPEDRAERGRELAGSVSKRSKGSKRSSGNSEGSGSGGGSSASPSVSTSSSPPSSSGPPSGAKPAGGSGT